MPSCVPRLSASFVRTMRRLGLSPGSPDQRSVLATIRALADTGPLPGTGDVETSFAPGRAHVRRVAGRNLWVLYRFNATYIDIIAVRRDPPLPLDLDDPPN